IVSARNRDINAGPYDDFIQTDAPINRGNSGGPLIDMDGNVVGVNSEIYSPSGGSVGIGFSIPSNLVRQVIGQLRQYGAARRGWIGVSIQPVTPEIAEGMGLPGTGGALVSNVTANGPAAHAGMQKSDVVVGFDGKPVTDSRSLPRIVADTPIGKTVNIDVLRHGRKQTMRIVVARLDEGPPDRPGKKLPPPAPPKAKSKIAQIGLTLGLLDGETRSRFQIPGNVQGVAITDVDPSSAAAEKNIRPGDVIVEVQNQPMHTPQDVTRRIDADVKAGRKVELMLINRGGNLTYVGLKLN
ncbi:MAG TPA: PDZ domain-containing protein, partial [Rhizomicrobium sp.]